MPLMSVSFAGVPAVCGTWQVLNRLLSHCVGTPRSCQPVLWAWSIPRASQSPHRLPPHVGSHPCSHVGLFIQKVLCLLFPCPTCSSLIVQGQPNFCLQIPLPLPCPHSSEWCITVELSCKLSYWDLTIPLVSILWHQLDNKSLVTKDQPSLLPESYLLQTVL